MGTREQTTGEQSADRVVLSHPADLSDRGRWRLGRDHYRGYLEKTLGRVAVGDEFEEFVDVGCCGSQRTLTLRVEAVEGGAAVTPETTIEFVTRTATDGGGGWAVQHECRPTGEAEK
jgi:hypothetical protein